MMNCACCGAGYKQSGIVQRATCECSGYCILCHQCEKHHRDECTEMSRRTFMNIKNRQSKELDDFRQGLFSKLAINNAPVLILGAWAVVTLACSQL